MAAGAAVARALRRKFWKSTVFAVVGLLVFVRHLRKSGLPSPVRIAATPVRIAAIAWCSQIPGLQVYLFRRQYADLIHNHLEGPKGFRALLSPWTICGLARIVDGEIRFWNGSKIYLCHCHNDADIYDYQGAEIHVLLIDELIPNFSR